MNLEFKGQEQIARPKSDVWSFITVPANVAKCLPDLIDFKTIDDKTFEANVKVAVGPVRGKFKFNIALDPKPDGQHMGLKISGGGFGSVIDLLASADLAESGGTTTLDWQGTATARGPVATVGGRVLDAQARKLISETFGNIKTRLLAAA